MSRGTLYCLVQSILLRKTWFIPYALHTVRSHHITMNITRAAVHHKQKQYLRQSQAPRVLLLTISM